MTMPEILRRKLMERIDIASEPDDGEVLEEIDGLILGEEETRYLPVAQKAELRRQLFYSVRRLDVLQELLEDAGITEIMVNGYQHIFVERNGRIERYGKSFTSAEKLEDVIQQIVGRCNRVVNEQNPIVDARLENGDRVNVVMKPVALNGPILTIRRFPEQAVTMEFLVSIGSITKEAAEFLQALVRTRYSMMIGGATGSGKTTFLNALSAYIPKGERIITIEDNAELQIQGVENLVRLEAKEANLESGTEITIRDLIRAALRMRPNRLVPVRNRGIAACAKVHLFCGKTEEEADEEEGEAKQMVWVTENGSVYHTDSSCSHINLSIQVSSPGALAWKRNQDGEKYKECEQCVGNGAAGAEVYYTKYGNRYHNSLSCKGLKRKVKLVALEQTDGLPQCSKCAKKAA